MGRSLDELHSKALPSVNAFLAKLMEEQIPVVIVTTGRTQEEQNEKYAQGRTKPGQIVTWTLDSLHVMSEKRGFKSCAIDICPFETFQIAGPDKLNWKDGEIWDRIGAIGQSFGLKWGVIGKDGIRKDKGHFEYIGEL